MFFVLGLEWLHGAAEEDRVADARRLLGVGVRASQAWIAEQLLHVGVAGDEPGLVAGDSAHACDWPLGLQVADGRRNVEQILAAATRAFARSGFAATSLDDIAAEAGISRVILYRHFESKTDLYRAVLERARTRIAASVGTDNYTSDSVAKLLRCRREPGWLSSTVSPRRTRAGVQRGSRLAARPLHRSRLRLPGERRARPGVGALGRSDVSERHDRSSHRLAR